MEQNKDVRITDSYLLAPEVIMIGDGIATQKEMLEPLITQELRTNIEGAHLYTDELYCVILSNQAT